jgi:hypothetical protein
MFIKVGDEVVVAFNADDRDAIILGGPIATAAPSNIYPATNEMVIRTGYPDSWRKARDRV